MGKFSFSSGFSVDFLRIFLHVAPLQRLQHFRHGKLLEHCLHAVSYIPAAFAATFAGPKIFPPNAFHLDTFILVFASNRCLNPARKLEENRRKVTPKIEGNLFLEGLAVDFRDQGTFWVEIITLKLTKPGKLVCHN